VFQTKGVLIATMGHSTKAIVVAGGARQRRLAAGAPLLKNDMTE